MESSPITGIISDYMFFMQVNIEQLMWGKYETRKVTKPFCC